MKVFLIRVVVSTAVLFGGSRPFYVDGATGNDVIPTESPSLKSKTYDTSGKEGLKVSTRASQAPDPIHDGLPVLNYTTLFKDYCFLFGGTL
eukprot:jgi/Botrbrau1/23551/Bobra.0141s0022.1